jgi:spore maturation protein CgeB
MKFVWFVHAIASCWNNGNAHFLRGLARALQAKGHDVTFFEPRGGWSEENLFADHGAAALAGFEATFPDIKRRKYDASDDPEELIGDADVVIVHEWNEAPWVRKVAQVPRRFLLLFHDTHHRVVTDPDSAMWSEIADYDGVVAFGEAVAEVYRRRGWSRRVWTLHEAADISVFYPRDFNGDKRDLVWIGNWGDEERSAELREFLIDPAADLNLATSVYGVRYPEEAVTALQQAGIAYRGWLPNHRVPEIFAAHRATVHVPRGPYAKQLPGIPTIRVFEALACGIPLVSAPWSDCEGLFPEGCWLMAKNGNDMRAHLRVVLHDSALRGALVSRGLDAIRTRHTTAHRADQLLAICGAEQRSLQCA